MPGKLTERQDMALHYLAQGMSVKEIARRMEISPDTVKLHLKNIYQKLGLHNRVQAALWYHGIQTDLS
jgi:DNA-binding NarL/FixJ family response regulator